MLFISVINEIMLKKLSMLNLSAHCELKTECEPHCGTSILLVLT